jgi:MFS transporter, PAT family, beta-lactamase induction signal transducer AmpG
MTDKAIADAVEIEEKPGIGAFFERASLVMFGLGFAAGMPNQLAGVALAIWLREAGASLALIGLMGLCTLTYALKFLWSPIVDRVPIPILDARMGRRRSWMVVTQIGVIIGLLLMATRDPGAAFTPAGDATSAFIPFAAFTVLIAFAGATQDITIDAWRIEVAREGNRLGVLTATYQWGYRVAILLSGALPLFIAQALNGDTYQAFGWAVAYLAMAGFMLLAILASVLAPRETVAPAPRWVPPADVPDRGIVDIVEWVGRLALMVLAGCVLGVGLAGKAEPLAWLVADLYGGTEAMSKALAAKPWGVYQQLVYAVVGLSLVVCACLPIPGVKSRPASYFKAALGDPVLEFFATFKDVATLILVFVCVYRIADFVLNLTSTLYLDAGFSKDEIAFAQKFFGAAMAALGAGLSGWGVLKVGMFRCLIIGAFLQPLSNLAFISISLYGANLPALYVAIGIDNISGMFAGTSFIIYLSTLTKSGFTATQYALFTSLYALPGKIITALGGRIVEGAAKSAETGWLGSLKPWFNHLPPEAFAAGGAKLGVTGQALAAGYTAFFAYTSLIGIVGIVAALAVSRGKARKAVEDHERAEVAAEA